MDANLDMASLAVDQTLLRLRTLPSELTVFSRISIVEGRPARRSAWDSKDRSKYRGRRTHVAGSAAAVADEALEDLLVSAGHGVGGIWVWVWVLLDLKSSLAVGYLENLLFV